MSDPGDQVRSMLQSFLAEEMPPTELVRNLLRYPYWQVPVSNGGPIDVISHDSGGHFARLFTDPRAVSECAAALGGPPPQAAQALGYHVFGAIPTDLDWLDVNPYSEPTVHFEREQLAPLSGLARAIEIEEILGTLNDVPDGFHALRAFEAFYIVLRPEGGGMQMVLAPDDDGRQLAAIFTARDCLDSFLREAIPALNLQSFQILQLNGDSLFGQLRSLPLNGLVFNCMGPATPRAFGMQIAEHVLTA